MSNVKEIMALLKNGIVYLVSSVTKITKSFRKLKYGSDSERCL